MTLNLDVMRAVHENSVQSFVFETLGTDGQEVASRLADRLPTIHAALDVDLLPQGLFAFAAPEGTPALPGFSDVLDDLASLDPYPRSSYTVEVLEKGFRVKPNSTTPARFPDGAVGYSFTHPAAEQWHVGDQARDVFNPTTDQSTVFGTLVFTDLERALNDYYQKKVRECRCTILAAGWVDHTRIYWRQKPEIQVRRSLENFLDSCLRAVVEVEHIVDEDKEVDVVVFWNNPRRGALIECKWMGVSASDKDGNGRRKITKFGPADARKGFGQIADYLDRKRPRAGDRTFKGYLVVIDGRRRGAGDPDDGRVFTVDDLMHFEHAGVQDWDADLLARTDLAQPRVMFCRPRL